MKTRYNVEYYYEKEDYPDYVSDWMSYAEAVAEAKDTLTNSTENGYEKALIVEQVPVIEVTVDRKIKVKKLNG